MARLIDSGPGCPTPTPLRGASAAEARGLVYDDAVKMEPVVEPLVDQLQEVGRGLRGAVHVKLQRDVADAGTHREGGHAAATRAGDKALREAF